MDTKPNTAGDCQESTHLAELIIKIIQGIVLRIVHKNCFYKLFSVS